MSKPTCACASLERLEGASVPAYIASFLEPEGGGTARDRDRLRCRVCGQEWERSGPEGEAKRPSLVKRNERG